MKDFEELRRELWTLLDVLCEGGELPEDARNRLNELLRHDERLRFEYLAYLTLDSTLARETDEPAPSSRNRWSDILLHDAMDGSGCVLCESLEELDENDSSPFPGNGFFTGRFSLGLLVAFLIFLGIATTGYYAFFTPPTVRSTRPRV